MLRKRSCYSNTTTSRRNSFLSDQSLREVDHTLQFKSCREPEPREGWALEKALRSGRSTGELPSKTRALPLRGSASGDWDAAMQTWLPRRTPWLPRGTPWRTYLHKPSLPRNTLEGHAGGNHQVDWIRRSGWRQRSSTDERWSNRLKPSIEATEETPRRDRQESRNHLTTVIRSTNHGRPGLATAVNVWVGEWLTMHGWTRDEQTKGEILIERY